jgi:hypothetical protein
MDQKQSSKVAYNFKDKASAFNYLMANAPVGSLEKVLSHFSNLYKFKEEPGKAIEGVLNYHLNHLTIIKYKENFLMLSSANWVGNRNIKVWPMNLIQSKLNENKTHYGNIFNPTTDRISTKSSGRYVLIIIMVKGI